MPIGPRNAVRAPWQFNLADANPELRTALVEGYSNEGKPSDGEAYCKVWQYKRKGNVYFNRVVEGSSL